MKPGFSVLIPTYNNAGELRKTLAGFERTDWVAHDVEWTVIDNNSADETKSVVTSAQQRLPVQYLFERRQGKNCALNKALETVSLRGMVFLTDDDVDVPESLFGTMRDALERWPGHSVFGGHVHLVWPSNQVPEWALRLAGSYRAYSHLNLGSEERVFGAGSHPVGTNLWIKGELFVANRRYDELLGPHPTNRIWGDETAFLLKLREEGHVPVYLPTVRIGHRVPEELVTVRGILRRGIPAGRGSARLHYGYVAGRRSPPPASLPRLTLRALAFLRWGLRYGLAFTSLSKARQMTRRWDAMQGMGWNLEAVRIGLSARRAGFVPEHR